MNDANTLTEMKATLALSDLNRRERLLKIIRGKSDWKYYAFGTIYIIIIMYIYREQTNLIMFLIPLLFIIAGAYANFSKRINALIELIGEDNLRKPKIDDQK